MEPRALSGSGASQPTAVAGSGEPAPGERVLGTLDELLSLARGLVAEGRHSNLAAARARVAEDRFNLVVLGEFKRGKSTLINALLGREVLPTGVLPLTSVVTAIGPGERDRLLIRYTDGHEQQQPLAELAEYVTEARNPGNRLGVEFARIELDHELLRAGLELVDTPGIGSIHSHNTQVAREFLPRVDAAVCVLDAGQPLSESERELFGEAAQRVPRMLIVVNKIDHLDVADRADTLEFIRSALQDLFGDHRTELFAVSARERLGLRPLVDRLQRLADEEREDLLLRSVAALAVTAAADTAQAARFESRAIELPLEELAARAELFEQRISELRAASEEAGDLLDRGVARALDEHVNGPLKEHARRNEPRLHALLRRQVQELGGRSARALSAELQAWVDAQVRADFEELVPRIESVIAEELAQLERRHAGRVQRILEQVQETAEDVFGTRASDVLPETGLRAPSRFSFKLKDVENALDMIVGLGRTITPGTLGRRLVVRDADQRLVAMTDRHAGRLRSELAERVAAAAREYRRELAARIDDAVSAIRAAIDRASNDRQHGQQHAQARLAELAAIEARCEQTSSRLTDWLQGSAPGVQGNRRHMASN